MSNESENKNKRIDLTKFEGMTEGPWHFCLPYNAETDTYEGDAQMKGGGDRVNGPVVLSQYQFARGTANQRADLRAMESCPELIAELKRCYYEIDLLQEYAKCGNCGGRYIGPMDYGLHEQEHSEDCDFYHDTASE